ncbi:hypothetical protein GCM10010302_32310 [Streptomyces polychromogenes]|uniref:Secreted protein n=1 Tax=Streptomyces polychromogenes TaxID=67342 RepID=A0ABN0VDS5_9ACTN
MSITPRRIAPPLIATTAATAGITLTTTTANAAPAHTTTGVTNDSDNPFVDALRKSAHEDRRQHLLNPNLAPHPSGDYGPLRHAPETDDGRRAARSRSLLPAEHQPARVGCHSMAKVRDRP